MRIFKLRVLSFGTKFIVKHFFFKSKNRSKSLTSVYNVTYIYNLKHFFCIFKFLWKLMSKVVGIFVAKK